jgi:hypothetical protein
MNCFSIEVSEEDLEKCYTVPRIQSDSSVCENIFTSYAVCFLHAKPVTVKYLIIVGLRNGGVDMNAVEFRPGTLVQVVEGSVSVLLRAAAGSENTREKSAKPEYFRIKEIHCIPMLVDFTTS